MLVILSDGRLTYRLNENRGLQKSAFGKVVNDLTKITWWIFVSNFQTHYGGKICIVKRAEKKWTKT